MPLRLAVASANVVVDVLSFNHTSLTQNRTQKEKLLKKYRLCDCSRTFQNGQFVGIIKFSGLRNTFWPLIQLSLNLTCSSLCEVGNAGNTGLTAPRDLGVSIQLCVGQRLAGNKAIVGTKMEPDSCVRWRKISKHIHLQKRIEGLFR